MALVDEVEEKLVKQTKEIEGKLEKVVKINGDLEDMIEENINKNMDEHMEKNMKGMADIIAKELKAQEEMQGNERRERDEEIIKLLRETKADNLQVKERMKNISAEIKRDRDERVKLDKKIEDNAVKNEEIIGKLEEELNERGDGKNRKWKW